MVNLYTAICVQANRRSVSHRKEIREANLNRALELIDFAATRLTFPNYAPTRLILFPEVFMQGWWAEPGPYTNVYEKVAKDIAIRIPGEETNLLAAKAKEYKTYIAGTVHEVIPELGENYPFNCGFIISPEGEVIYKYHKYDPYMAVASRDDVSPHDVYDRYLEVMDGKYGRKKGDILSCFFPVIDTDIGRLGYVICNAGNIPENYRAVAVQGCEVMLRSSGMQEPTGSPPQNRWELSNRSGAYFNLMYVVACAPGDIVSSKFPINVFPGHSMIVDFDGALICHADYQGEAVTGAVIDIERLRKRRTDPNRNWLTQLRTEPYREIYARPIYPKNLFVKGPVSFKDRVEAQAVKRFLKERIYTPPSTQ